MIVSQVWQLLTSFLPSWVSIAILSIVTIIVVFLVIKLIGLVLDAIPFV